MGRPVRRGRAFRARARLLAFAEATRSQGPKRNKVDYNEASKASEETHNKLTPPEQAEHRKATERLFNCKPEEQEGATKRTHTTKAA
ncbi:hypothetical protein [Bradyrhizobium sp. 2S1]|uniref:hypothetical protein n=1 Tax=Bradyrhizobium sp. 2S1 TaxID=1404429 RepID=UPI0014094B10|nr:hypothetical protein [Bradyrhizobium sp. 2S1]MCK7664589.1 hypothetical protein [Bradyrhizobium sp. 2S1]